MGKLKYWEDALGSSIKDAKKAKRSKKKHFEDVLGLVGEDEDVKVDPQRAARLQTLYTAFKGVKEKLPFRRKTKNPVIISAFNKIAKKLAEEEHRSLEEIDDGLFVLGLFAKYGKETYPGHLLGSSAISIYREKLREVFPYPRAILSKDYDDKLLKGLCESREETEEEVIEALEHAGVFSAKFIRKWKKINSRKLRRKEPKRSRSER